MDEVLHVLNVLALASPRDSDHIDTELDAELGQIRVVSVCEDGKVDVAAWELDSLLLSDPSAFLDESLDLSL